MITPGPWKIVMGRKQGRGPYVCADRGGDIIVAQAGTLGPGEAEANARAIAALPELIEALKDCLRWSPYRGESEETDHLRKCRAALLKAGVTR